MSFNEWYKLLTIYFGKIQAESYPYIAYEPESWCEKEVWEKDFNNGLSVEGAYLNQC